MAALKRKTKAAPAGRSTKVQMQERRGTKEWQNISLRDFKDRMKRNFAHADLVRTFLAGHVDYLHTIGARFRLHPDAMARRSNDDVLEVTHRREPHVPKQDLD